ncbi:ribonuclease H-like domain-containing protein [Tanacetum coccineum]
MQKNVLKHQFENFTTASNESLDKAYDRFQKLISQLEVHGAPISKEDINQKFLRSLPPSWNQIALIMRNKPDIDEIDIDDLYNNLRVYEDEMKRSSSSTSTSQNLAFLSSENTSSVNEVSIAEVGDFDVSTAGGISQIDEDDLEELDLRWQVAMLTVRVKKFIQKTGRNLDFKEKRPVSLDKSKIECYNCHRKGHFARECRSGRNQGRRSYSDNGRSNAPTNESSSQALVAQGGLRGYDWSNDFEVEPVNYALMAISSSSSSSSSDNEGNLEILLQDHAVVDSGCSSYMTGNKAYLSDYKDYNGGFVAFRSDPKGGKITGKGKIRTDNLDFDDVYFVDELKSSDEDGTLVANDRFLKQDGVSGVPLPITGTDHLIKDCNFHDKQSQEPKLKTVVNTGPRVDKPVWDNTKRQNEKRAVHTASTARPVSTARHVSTVRPFASKIAQTGGAIRPIYQEWTMKTKEVYIHLSRAVVNTGKGKMDTDLRKSRENPVILLRIMQWWIVGCSSLELATKLIFQTMRFSMEDLWLLGSDPKGGKFYGKSDEGYLLGYSTTSKAFRVYNKRTKRVEENLHIDFLEDQPNMAGTSPNWMFDLAFLTNSMNYIPVSVENQVNVDAVEDVAPAAHEKPSESSFKDNDGQYSKDVANKEGQHQMTEDEQVLHDELEKMIAQEVVAKALDDATRQAFEEEKRNIASQKRIAQATSINKLSTSMSSVSTATTPYVSTASTPTGANADLPIDPNMPDLEDDSDAFSNDGIFNGAYDDENMGAVH